MGSENRVTIAAVGDVFLGRRVYDIIAKRGPDYIFDRVRSLLRGHDVVVGNLESPISEVEARNEMPQRLIARPIALDGLKRAGFNAVSLANNHIMDFGPAALQDTLRELRRRQIGMAGAGLNEAEARQPLRQVGGKNVSLLAYYGLGKGGNVALPLQRRGHPASQPMSSGACRENPGHNSGQIDHILNDIQAAREGGALVLVYIHATVSALDLPMRHQADLARRMIDYGAAAVLLAGPHVLQPVERYNDGVIAYSLGNFVFDLEDRPNQKHSMILHLAFAGHELQSVRITPVQIDAEHCPAPIDPVGNPELYGSIRSLLVDRLDEYASDAHVLSKIRLRDLTPGKVLKKLVWRGHGVYPLSVYIRGLRALLRERWTSRK